MVLTLKALYGGANATDRKSRDSSLSLEDDQVKGRDTWHGEGRADWAGEKAKKHVGSFLHSKNPTYKKATTVKPFVSRGSAIQVMSR